MTQETDDPRRRILLRMLAAGFFTGMTSQTQEAFAQAFGTQILGTPPSKLPEGKSIYRVSGEVLVDGKQASLETKIGGGATIKTGGNGELVYAVNQSAYIARANSEIVVESTSGFVSSLRLLTGKLLSVFPSGRPVKLQTRVASIGIRGTGAYMETDPEQTYFCTCYGVADVNAINDPESQTTVAASHHDRPLYILGNESKGKNIRNGPFINHTDAELALIETLVGREPPFVFPKSDYSGPRRNY